MVNPYVSASVVMPTRTPLGASAKASVDAPSSRHTAVDICTLGSTPAAADTESPRSPRTWLGAAALGIMALGGLGMPAPAMAATPVLSQTLSLPDPGSSFGAFAPTARPQSLTLSESGSALANPAPTPRSSALSQAISRPDSTINPSTGKFELSLPEPKATGSWRFDLETHNDSYPSVLGLTPLRFMNPAGGGYTDDDGFTAGFGARLTHTDGDKQLVAQGRYNMVTELGGWPPYSPTYGARRTDLLDVAVQQNFRERIDDKTHVFYGVGAGVQAIGPMGGQSIQEWWHTHGVSGRLGDALQHNYTTTSVEVTPMVTGGVGVDRQLDAAGSYHLVGTLEANAPLGQGIGAVRAKVGVEARPISWMALEAGVTATGVWSNSPAMDFHNVSGVRPGAWTSATFNPNGTVSPYVWAETGGVRNEPQYGIGVTIHFGGRSTKSSDAPWLNPVWR